MFGVVFFLNLPAPIGFADRIFHRFCDLVGVKNCLAFGITRRAAHRLDERAFRTQKTFLIGIEYCDERDLRQIEAFAKKVDAN